MKVIVARSRSQERDALNFLFSHCKTSVGNKSGSIEDGAVKFACDRHLCHMTGSDHAYN